MKRLDGRVEVRINKVVDTVATLRDSNDSKTRVARKSGLPITPRNTPSEFIHSTPAATNPGGVP